MSTEKVVIIDKKLLFIGEAKSEWKEWRPDSMLNMAEEDLKDHLKKAKGWKVPEKGYVFAVRMSMDEIEIWWREVDLSGIIERS